MINRKYIQMSAGFWMLYCISGSFISLYLQSQGVDNQGIGIVTALFGAISAVLQPMLGNLCDRSSRITWKRMIFILAVPFLMVCVLMLLIPGTLTAALFVGLLLLLGNTILPFLNGAMSYYQRKQEYINYGVARGVGSGLFALTALLVGNLAERHGAATVPAAGIVITGFFLVSVMRMPCGSQESTAADNTKRNSQGFVRRYPAFALMTAAFVILSTSHNIVGTYLLQLIQSLGGGSGEFGNAVAIQATVEVPLLFGFVWLLKKLPASKWLLISALGYGLKAICYAMAQDITAIYLIQFTQILNFAIFASASVYYTIEVVAEEDQVTGQALMTSTMAAGTVLGSLLGGWIIDSFGMAAMLRSNVGISLAGILMAFASHWLLIRQQNRRKV